LRIYSLAVDVRFARRGVGRALLQACEAYARYHRREALTLEVRYDNAAAIALYESCGFRQFGEHAHYYADGATALRYEKLLLPASQREAGNNSLTERVRPLRRASRPR
jgi:ribosomal protein S18 acetylase RimI-like enzyme